MGEAEAGVLNEDWLFIKNGTRLEHPEATAQARKWLMKIMTKSTREVSVRSRHGTQRNTDKR